MSLRPTIKRLLEDRPHGLGRMRLYARSVDIAMREIGADYLGCKVVINPTIPPDRLEIRGNKGELLSTIMIPGKA